MNAVEVHGTVAAGFEGVRDEFAALLDEEPREPTEPGAQLAVSVGGERVVDLWGGEGVTADSLTAVYSTTKGAAHLVVALLVQDGTLDLDRAVAHYWPEFAAEGKGGLTLRDLLGHRAGLLNVDGGFTPEELADDRLMAARLAGQRPFWRPGEGYGYHAFVIGALTGEVVLRATGRSMHELYEERIRAPYGLDFFAGLPEEQEARYLDLLPVALTPEQRAAQEAEAERPGRLPSIAFNERDGVLLDLVELVGRRATRAAGPMSMGGVASGRGQADLYAAALTGLDGRPPLLAPETIAEFTAYHPTGTDLVTGDHDHFSLGFENLHLSYPGLSPDAFGHQGAAGAHAFADPRDGLAYGYTRRRFGATGVPAQDNIRLVAALTKSLR